jgi:hypothetical protein
MGRHEAAAVNIARRGIEFLEGLGLRGRGRWATPGGRSSGLGIKPKATTGIRRKQRKSYFSARSTLSGISRKILRVAIRPSLTTLQVAPRLFHIMPYRAALLPCHRVCPKIVGQLLAVVLQSGQPDKIGTDPMSPARASRIQ